MKRIWLILLITLAVFAPMLVGSWGLTESSEARYAEISREMYTSGDYVNPTLLGIKHFHKPPLTYYITAAGYSLFGINETGARSFLTIALLLQLLLLYKIALFLYKNSAIAMMTMLLYFAFPITQIAAKNLTTDCYLATFIFAGIYFFLAYHTYVKKIWLYFFYISCGLAFLTKGPVGIMPQAIFALCWLKICKPPNKFSIHNFFALLLGLLTAFSWFIVLLYQNPAMLQYFVGHQLVDRVSGNSFDRSKPFWYYFAMMPLLGFPVILIFGDYFLKNIKRPHFTNPTNKLLCIVLLSCLLVFSLSSSKLVLYVLPLYAFIAMLCARHLAAVPAARYQKLLYITSGFMVVLLILPVVAVFLKTGFDLPKAFIFSLSVAGIIVLFILVKIKFTTPITRLPACLAAGIFFLVMMMPPVMRANELAVNSVKPLYKLVEKELSRTGQTIIVYNQLLPSLQFYADKKIITIDDGNRSTARETLFEDAGQSYRYFYYRLPEDSVRLKVFVEKTNCMFFLKKTDSLPEFLLQSKPVVKRIEAGKWSVYY